MDIDKIRQGTSMTKDLSAFARERGIKYFMISFTDLFGGQRAKLVPTQAIADMQEEGAGFAGFATWLDLSPAHPDMFAIPDPDSVIQLPWKPEVAWVAADCIMEGTPVEQAPRNVLKAQIAKAAELGLLQTKFTGPSGLHEGNISSARDVSRLISEASRRPRIAEIMRKRSYRINTNRRSRDVRNTNRLLDTSLDVMAGKTGYIDEAGYCLATLVRFDEERAIAVVVLGAGSSSIRFRETRRLVDWLSKQARFLLTSAAE